MSISVWQTVEFDALSRNFSHAEYVEFHKRTKCAGAVVIEEAYKCLKQAFNTQLENDIGGNPDARR